MSLFGKAKTSVESFLDPGNCQHALRRARVINTTIKRVYPTYEMDHDQLSVIVLNPELVDLQDMRFTTAENIIEEINRHIVLSNQYITSSTAAAIQPIVNPDIINKPLGDDDTIKQGATGVKRKSDLKDKVYKRDDHKCIVSGLAHPEAAHLLPVSAVNTRTALSVTADCWKIIPNLLSIEFYDRYVSNIHNAVGFEVPANLISLAPHVHDFLDRGFWAFEPDSFKEQHNLGGSGFKARRPADGSGYIGVRMEGGDKVKTGQKFKIHHESIEQAETVHASAGPETIIEKSTSIDKIYGDTVTLTITTAATVNTRKTVTQTTVVERTVSIETRTVHEDVTQTVLSTPTAQSPITRLMVNDDVKQVTKEIAVIDTITLYGITAGHTWMEVTRTQDIYGLRTKLFPVVQTIDITETSNSILPTTTVETTVDITSTALSTADETVYDAFTSIVPVAATDMKKFT
uniref:HNH nuclease domain-containing protein n=1 Tax=Gibberella zeae TaxID=5518 RepID=A0A4E9EMB7_GIBZA